MPKFIINSGDVTVRGDFIENIMPDLNGAFVKVYLYAKYLASKGAEVEYSLIAEKLGLLESEVTHAFSILQECELISIEKDEIIFDAALKEENVESKHISVNNAEAPPVPAGSVKIQYSVTEMSRELESNKSLSDMLKVAQEVMGKPFNSKDINTLFWFYDGLNFSPEVILMLLEYCVSSEKRSMAYVEKVAISWHERGVNTIDDVEKLIAEENEVESFVRNLKHVFGINDRKLTKMEENFILDWKNHDNMSEEMIALAYEYSVLQINKLSFPYMNKIIKRWKANGIFTVEDAEADNERFRNKSSVQNSENKDSSGGDYDYEAIEKRMWNNI